MRPSALYETLKAAAGRTTSAVAANRFRAVLVTSELAIALVLLVGAGLLIKGFTRLRSINPGFNSANVVTMFHSWSAIFSETRSMLARESLSR